MKKTFLRLSQIISQFDIYSQRDYLCQRDLKSRDRCGREVINKRAAFQSDLLIFRLDSARIVETVVSVNVAGSQGCNFDRPDARAANSNFGFSRLSDVGVGYGNGQLLVAQ